MGVGEGNGRSQELWLSKLGKGGVRRCAGIKAVDTLELLYEGLAFGRVCCTRPRVVLFPKI